MCGLFDVEFLYRCLGYERNFNKFNFVFFTLMISICDFMVDTELSLCVFITSLQDGCTLDFTFKVQSVSELQRNKQSIAAFVHEYGCPLVYFLKDIMNHRKETKLF